MYTKTTVFTSTHTYRHIHFSLHLEHVKIYTYISLYLGRSRHLDGFTLLWVRREHLDAPQIVPTEMVPDAIKAQKR